jgi:hypothetical protein
MHDSGLVYLPTSPLIREVEEGLGIMIRHSHYTDVADALVCILAVLVKYKAVMTGNIGNNRN